jgi:hypothetical protein
MRILGEVFCLTLPGASAFSASSPFDHTKAKYNILTKVDEWYPDGTRAGEAKFKSRLTELQRTYNEKNMAVLEMGNYSNYIGLSNDVSWLPTDDRRILAQRAGDQIQSGARGDQFMSRYFAELWATNEEDFAIYLFHSQDTSEEGFVVGRFVLVLLY